MSCPSTLFSCFSPLWRFSPYGADQCRPGLSDTWLCPYYIRTWLNSSCAWVFHRQHCLHTCCGMIMEFFAFTVYGHSIHFFVNYMAKCPSRHCIYIMQYLLFWFPISLSPLHYCIMHIQCNCLYCSLFPSTQHVVEWQLFAMKPERKPTFSLPLPMNTVRALTTP